MKELKSMVFLVDHKHLFSIRINYDIIFKNLKGKNMFKLSITGADNLVDVNSLSSLVKDFPALELAILYFPEKENHPRNPGKEWRDKFFSIIPKENTAIHLCGQQVFETILSSEFETSDVFKELKKTNRIQININARKDIFSHQDIQQIYTILLSHGFTLILQYHNRSKDWILPYITDKHLDNVHILLDASLGKGVTPDIFEVPKELQELDYPIGFAGGLNPENIASVHTQVKNLVLKRYWLDLESGVRTDNTFNLVKAKLLCTLVFKL